MAMAVLKGGGDERVILDTLMFRIYVSAGYNTKG
jgi:hypothetical protein